MTPVPRFHRTQTSTQASNEAAKTEKPLASPPRKLETLTLGCKIGFILVYPRYHIANSDIEGTAKNIVHCKGTHEYKLPVSMQDPHENDRKQNQYWKVDIDPNAHLHDQEFESLTGRYYVVGIQIINRVFKFHNRTACPGDKFASPIDGNWIYHNHHERRAQHHWAVEVKAVDQALKTLSKKPNYRVLTNEFTDFKVYVGNVDHGVHMDVTRSLMAIFTAFERQFDAINTTTRIGGGVRGEPAPVASRPKLGYKYISDDLTEIQQEAGEGCKPMSSVNMSYLKLQGLESGYDIRSFLRIYLKGDLSRVQLQKFLDNELITHKNTVLDVSRMWDDKLIAYNPEYVSNYCMKKPTVAFRSHAGTLDSTEQIAWMDLCGVLTEYCYLFNLRAVHNWTRRRWTKPHNTYAILNILEHLDGKNNDTYAHYERVMTPINNPEPTLDQAHISCIFASFRTSTRTTLSRHSVLETDASTKTTGTSEKHTKISTYSSVPTTAFTESLVSTSTVQLIESTPPPVHIIVTDPPVHVTVAPAKARPTCCRYPSGGYPYIDSKVDTTCLDPLFRDPFARFHDPAINSAQFCAWSKSRLHDFFMTKVFDNVCNKGMDPEGNKARIAANEA